MASRSAPANRLIIGSYPGWRWNYDAKDRGFLELPIRVERVTGTSCTACTMHTDYPDWSLPAHRRGTLSGMDAAPEPTWTYLRRVPRWWAGKGPAARPQPYHPTTTHSFKLPTRHGSRVSAYRDVFRNSWRARALLPGRRSAA
ncbi:hypothetical protein C1H21_04715 [Xanthomonas arboricola pv. juglandis]|nr:hypothetical protein C1H21_04715 [Xanthomonas arboricola pv. juglandis]